MSGIATAIVGSAIVGGIVSNRGSNRAADVQENAAEQAVQENRYATDASVAINNRALRETQRQFDAARADLAPWQVAGRRALGQISSGTQTGGQFDRRFSDAAFRADPGYQYRLDQGRDVLEGAAAARGQLLSGGTLKALTEYGQNMGAQEYGAAYDRYNTDLSGRYNRLAGIAGIGQTANQQLTAAGSNNSNTIAGLATNAGNTIQQGAAVTGNLLTQGANANAAGIIGGANAITGGIQSLGNFYMQSQMMNRYGGGGGGGGNYGVYNNPNYTSFGG